MRHEEIKNALILYSFNEMSEAEKRKLDIHLNDCEECKKYLEDIENIKLLIPRDSIAEINEQLLNEARMELQASLRSMKRKNNIFNRLFDFLPVPTRGELKYALASAFIVVVLGGVYLLMNPGNKNESKNILALNSLSGKENSRIENLSFINADFENGIVEVKYDVITPVRAKGTVNDPQIQILLAQSLIENENPGTRLKSVNAIISGNRLSTNSVLKNPLIQAIKYDKNPGVRKAGIEALCKMQYDDEIRDVLVYVLQKDSNAGLRIMAITCLDKLLESQHSSDAATIEILKKTLHEDENNYIKIKAQSILNKIEL